MDELNIMLERLQDKRISLHQELHSYNNMDSKEFEKSRIKLNEYTSLITLLGELKDYRDRYPSINYPKIHGVIKECARYIVATRVDGDYYYWGSFANVTQAGRIASSINGEVFDKQEVMGYEQIRLS